MQIPHIKRHYLEQDLLEVIEQDRRRPPTARVAAWFYSIPWIALVANKLGLKVDKSRDMMVLVPPDGKVTWFNCPIEEITHTIPSRWSTTRSYYRVKEGPLQWWAAATAGSSSIASLRAFSSTNQQTLHAAANMSQKAAKSVAYMAPAQSPRDLGFISACSAIFA
jgi:hypothetical protein